MRLKEDDSAGEIRLKKAGGSVGYEFKPWGERLDSVKDRPYLATVGLLGVFLAAVGVLSAVLIANKVGEDQIELVKVEDEEEGEEILVDVSGGVINPGIYKLTEGARINEAIVAAGGLAEKADRDWFSKNINLAAKVTDGMKIYIPLTGEETGAGTGTVAGVEVTGRVNVNTASAAELDELWGIGPATAEKIIDNRPYAAVEDLVNKKVLRSDVYERNKELLSVY